MGRKRGFCGHVCVEGNSGGLPGLDWINTKRLCVVVTRFGGE